MSMKTKISSFLTVLLLTGCVVDLSSDSEHQNSIDHQLLDYAETKANAKCGVDNVERVTKSSFTCTDDNFYDLTNNRAYKVFQMSRLAKKACGVGEVQRVDVDGYVCK